jgi:hypothetical protein
MDVSLLRKWIVKFIGRPFRVYVIGCVSIVPFATLPFSGCTNGGVGQRVGASLIVSAPDRQQGSFGMSEAAQNSAIVDWSKPATEQPGTALPTYGGRADH